ncbi:MAG: hypothetical protein L0Y72_10715 [Gemmataceae bacterium]|nr:hypothetical protein [Gemmataceae bacterium]MCI0739506.1 hypothetical protein [Gemmataceae bacterium]
MSRKALALLVTGVGTLAALWFGWFNRSGADPDDGQVRQIPLATVFSTNGQEGLQDPTTFVDEKCVWFLNQIYFKTHGMGASNAFLVSGDDIGAAVRATSEVFLGGRPANRPAAPDDGKDHDVHWLVVYLGVDGSNPPAWLIKSVERQGRRIRLCYEFPKVVYRTKDIYQYFAWVPVGKLGAGIYDLEVFDVNKSHVSLQRRVEIAPIQ